MTDEQITKWFKDNDYHYCDIIGNIIYYRQQEDDPLYWCHKKAFSEVKQSESKL